MRYCKAFVCRIFPAFRNFDLYDLFCSCIDRIIVHLNDLIAFSAVCSFRCGFHQADRFLFRNDLRKFKERRLEHCIDTSAKSDLFTDLNSVDRIELNVMVCDISFYLSRKMFLKTFHIPRTVQKECSAVNKLLYHVILVHIRRVMTCYKVCLMDQVCRFDR